jgi:fatty-acyl-CoA synthase
MGRINLKSIVRTCFGFVNFRTMIMLNMWWLKHRRNRTFFLFEGREYTYGEVYRQAQRYERFFLAERDRLVRAGKLGTSDRLALGIYMENAPEFIFASLAAGLSNSVLFAINTGFRGETLAKVMEQAKIAFLITDEASATEVEKALPGVSVFGRNDVLFVGDTGRIAGRGYTPIEEAISRTSTTVHPLPRVPIDNFSPVIIIYTSGTTSLPKAVPCAHVKMPGAGFVVQKDVRLTKRDRGYISMPLFHSNAWYIGILPQMIAGCSFVLKRRFSARAFEEDMLQYGVTFLNYVGQPLHYIIDALEKKYGSGEAVEKALARHPKNRFRLAYGNGASVVDRLKLMRYLGMEHIFEIYGSTEAVITTANRRGDPIESVGRAPKSVVILSEQGMECPPGIVDERGRLVNYDQAVGEICSRVGPDNLRFGGYLGDSKATSQKFRDGIYHSGDLGHIRMEKGRRYLYFNGRTDDWIRKDGENFSAENVLQFVQQMPGVDIAIAYGAPCDVSDEKVMVTVQMKKGEAFDPDKVHQWLERQQKEGGMDPKWMPDFIRVVESFPVTDTHKIVVRPYKREHYNITGNPDMVVYYREKGDTTYSRLTQEKFADMRECFIRNGRESLLV